MTKVVTSFLIRSVSTLLLHFMNGTKSLRRACPGFSDGKSRSASNLKRSQPFLREPSLKGPESPFLKLKEPFLRLKRTFSFQQRYFSYRAILVAIVSQNSFVLVFMGYRTIIARYVAKWGIAQMCLCETKYQGGVSHHFGGVLTSLKKYRAIWGIAAIVSQYRAIWGH